MTPWCSPSPFLVAFVRGGAGALAQRMSSIPSKIKQARSQIRSNTRHANPAPKPACITIAPDTTIQLVVGSLERTRRRMLFVE